ELRAGEDRALSVDHHDEISTVHVTGEGALVLPTNQGRDLRGDTPYGKTSGINDVPLRGLEPLLLGLHERLHIGSLPIQTFPPTPHPLREAIAKGEPSRIDHRESE